ncbi:MAG: HEAT repeat domain-containing protein [Candidatus Zixiibacteriota bacterium]
MNAQQGLKKKVDELFVKASSGEVMFRDMVEPAKDSIAAMGADAVPFLVEKFTTKSARERTTIIEILKKIGSPAVPYLIRSLKNPDYLIVQRVCAALGDIRDSSAVEPLMQVTSHKEWQVREQALGALGNIASSGAADPIVFSLEDSIGLVRKAAVVAAGKTGLSEAIRPLVHMLGDDFYGARLSAADALLRLDTTLVVEVLADSMISPNSFVGNLGCYVLGQIGSDDAIEVLMRQTRSEDPSRRAHAAVAIIKADPDDNCGYRGRILENETDRLTLLKIKSAI